MSKSNLFITKRPLRHDGGKYAEGESIELEDKFSDPLLSIGAIRAARPDESAKIAEQPVQPKRGGKKKQPDEQAIVDGEQGKQDTPPAPVIPTPDPADKTPAATPDESAKTEQ